jgi:hypothetical protein
MRSATVGTLILAMSIVAQLRAVNQASRAAAGA